MKPGDNTMEVPFSRLNEYERTRLEAAATLKGSPYHIVRRKTRAVAELLGCDEETAEAIVLGRIDARIMEG